MKRGILFAALALLSGCATLPERPSHPFQVHLEASGAFEETLREELERIGARAVERHRADLIMTVYALQLKELRGEGGRQVVLTADYSVHDRAGRVRVPRRTLSQTVPVGDSEREAIHEAMHRLARLMVAELEGKR